MHEDDIAQLTESLPIAEMFYDMSEYVDFRPSRLLNEGDTIKLGQSRIKVMHTPGHTEGGLSFITDAGVLCGDTIFAGSRGRTDLLGGSHDQLMSTIKNKILPLDDDTHLYPGHGPSTSVGTERRTNPSIAEIV
jgi:glyoxylase-like metal-dependent hydrolase (beta-lactamase superfamily II)